jgi:hypothetical protein
MNTHRPHRLAAFGFLVLSAIATATAQTATSTMLKHLIELPPSDERTVLGIWKSVEPMIDMTRTIEQVGTRYFMVARQTHENGTRTGGTHGLELRRINANEFHGIPPNESVYRISKNGELLMFAQGERHHSMRGVPHPQVWPR